MSDQERLHELSHFLKDRRARLSPASVGLPTTRRRRVAGLRREEVATLAGIGVSWYTSLENGEPNRVSEDTLNAVARALMLSESERIYLLTLAGARSEARGPQEPSDVLIAAMHAEAFPAYIITSAWEIVDFNKAFGRIWQVDRSELPVNAIARLFLDRRVRPMHGERFLENLRPFIAQLRSHQIRWHSESVDAVIERIKAEADLRALWDAYEVSGPFSTTTVTVETAVGVFRYEPLTLPIDGAQIGMVIQVPLDGTTIVF